MNAPPSTVSVARVRIGSTGPPFMTSAVVTAAAEVVAITMTVVDCSSPPATGPANDAYSPAIGLAPASTAVAIPSGTDPIAPARPAIVSRPHATLAITTLLFGRSTPWVARRARSVPVLGVEGGLDRGIRVLESGEVGQPQPCCVVTQLPVRPGEPDLGAFSAQVVDEGRRGRRRR